VHMRYDGHGAGVLGGGSSTAGVRTRCTADFGL
jgi:hypothetical protein